MQTRSQTRNNRLRAVAKTQLRRAGAPALPVSGVHAPVRSHQRPRAARGAAEQRGGGGVAQDLLLGGVPRDLAAGEHGDLPEVADARGAVGHFGRRQRGVARLDAVDEVALVPGAAQAQLAGFDLAVADLGDEASKRPRSTHTQSPFSPYQVVPLLTCVLSATVSSTPSA